MDLFLYINKRRKVFFFRSVKKIGKNTREKREGKYIFKHLKHILFFSTKRLRFFETNSTNKLFMNFFHIQKKRF